MEATRPEISIVVPVYNSSETLRELHQRLTAVLVPLGRPYELVLVNDGSRDHSWEILAELAAGDPKLRAVDLMRNFGQNNALMCGFHASRGDVVVTMDDDLQHPPEEIPKLLEALATSGDDVVIGAYRSKQHSLFRNLASSVSQAISRFILDIPRGLSLTSFRAMRRPVIDELLRFGAPHPRVGLMLFHVTARQSNTPVQHHARPRGRSTYTLKSLVRSFLDELINYSSLPMRAASWLGFGAAVSSFCLGLYYLVRYLGGWTKVSGWTTLVLLILFTFGMILTTLGIVGEYLIRIVRASEYRPQFVVRRTAHGFSAPPTPPGSPDP